MRSEESKKNKLNTAKEYFKKLRRCNNVQLLGTELNYRPIYIKKTNACNFNDISANVVELF